MLPKKKVAQLIASSVLFLSLAIVTLISRKQELIADQQADDEISLLKSLNVQHDSNDFGLVLDKNNKEIDNAIVEKVALAVPKHAQSDKKIVRYGNLVRYPNAKATVLICHGFMTDKHDVAFLRHLFPQGTLNFMTFDFRAHGQNCCGQKCTFGRDECLEVITAAHFLKNHPLLKGKPVIVYAFSMGAAAAIEAQSKDNSLFKAMILDCPFDSTENIIKKGLESIQFTFLGYDFSIPACSLLQKYAFHPYVQSLIKGILKTVANLDVKNIDMHIYPVNPAISAQKIDVPCFFIHCKNDEKISVNAVKDVYNSANSNYKILWVTNGRRHFDSFFYNPERYIKEIRSFLDTVVSGAAYNKQLQQIIEDPDELLVHI